MPDVGRERRYGPLVAIQREGVPPAPAQPVVVVEALAQRRGIGGEPVGERLVVPDLARESSGAQPGVVGVALDLTGGAGQVCDAPVREADRGVRVLPALVG